LIITNNEKLYLYDVDEEENKMLGVIEKMFVSNRIKKIMKNKYKNLTT
jgi:hypothetical protein